MAVLITAAVVIVFLPLVISAVILVCLTWTHRPDLSAIDISRVALKEIKNDLRAGRNRQAR